MPFILAFLWGIVARVRNIRQFPSALIVAWTDPRFGADRILLSMQTAWAIWLINPWVNTFASAAGYRQMASLATEMWWGIGLLVLALVHADSMIHVNWNVRRTVALLEMGTWVFIGWMFVVSNYASLAVPIYALLAWHYYRIYRAGRRI